MKKEELIRTINGLNDEIEKLVEPSIQAIIECSVSENKNHELIQNKDDVKGSVGFYMIFSNNTNFTNTGCTITYNNKPFYCVYRGHSYTTRERLISHLFYDKNSKYPNCMKIKIGVEKYNINIEEKKLYKNGKSMGIKFPGGDWIVVRIPLPKSKQAIREMFETAFDNKYQKPVFSEK